MTDASSNLDVDETNAPDTGPVEGDTSAPVKDDLSTRILGRPTRPTNHIIDNGLKLPKRETNWRHSMPEAEPDGLTNLFRIENGTEVLCGYFLLCIYACLSVGGFFCQFVKSTVIATQLEFLGSKCKKIFQTVERIVSLYLVVAISLRQLVNGTQSVITLICLYLFTNQRLVRVSVVISRFRHGYMIPRWLLACLLWGAVSWLYLCNEGWLWVIIAGMGHILNFSLMTGYQWLSNAATPNGRVAGFSPFFCGSPSAASSATPGVRRNYKKHVFHTCP